MFVLLLTVFIDLVGFGMVFPLLPFFALSFGASAFEVSVLIATYSAMQVVAAPFWGRLSDRYGRKWILLITLVGGAASYLWFGFAGSLAALFAARSLSGAMAGNIAVAQAYMADLTTPAERAGGMGKIGAAFGLGFVVGPALGGLLTGPDPANPDFRLPCIAAAVVSLAAALLGAVILREPARQERAARPRLQPGAWRAAAASHGIPGLIALSFVVTVVFTQLIAIFPLWTEARLGWGPREVGYGYAWIGLWIALLQGLVLGPFSKAAGAPRVLLTGAVAMSAGLLLMPALPSLEGFMVCALLLCIGSSFCHPVFTSMISQRTDAAHQGAVLGVAAAVASTGRIIGPPVAGLVFDHAGPDWPMLSGGVILWGVILAALVMSLRYRKTG